MESIAKKLEYLKDTKAQIKTAIEHMGVEVPDGTEFREYPELIKLITPQHSQYWGECKDL